MSLPSGCEIREAREREMGGLLGMCERFFAASGYGEVTNFNPDRMLQTLRGLKDEGRLLVADRDGLVGMAAGMLYPWYMGDSLTGQELFWWVEPEHRGAGIGRALREGLEDWARAQGATSWMMVALDGSPETARRQYAQAGYRPAEQVYVRRL